MVTQVCASCREESPSAMRCSRCKNVWYCSTRCQKEHWTWHIFDCKIDKPIDTSYHLARYCYRDTIPADAQTRIDYGFEKAGKALGGQAESKLLGLWIGVILYHSTSPQEVRKWRKEGKLIEGIKGVFEAIPPNNRGAYYPWFLQHQWLLDGTPIDSDVAFKSALASVEQSFLDAWVFIGGSRADTLKEVQDMVAAFPEDRYTCFTFYVTLVSGAYPHPAQSLWMQFGFVAVDEHKLGGKYQQLIRRCTFGEFCLAFETSSIPALLERHRLSMSQSPHFLDVMSGSPRTLKSVWSLKQYMDILICSTPEDDPPQLARSVFVDYGFINCGKPTDRKLLHDLYQRVFAQTGVDPLELHAACMQGQLLEYVRKFVELAPYVAEYTRLLKNPYPLPQP